MNMVINTEAKIKDRGNNLIRVNSEGISSTGVVDIPNYKLFIYSCDMSSGNIRLTEELNLTEMTLLRNYLNIFQTGDVPQISSEEDLILIQNQFSSIENIDTVRNLLSKLGTTKLNMIKDSLSDEELVNLDATIKQTIYRKEIDNLQQLVSIDKNHSSGTDFFAKINENEHLQKYLLDEQNKSIKQQEGVLENWIRMNLWVLGIEFYEDLRVKNLKKYIQGGLPVLPDFVFKNKSNFLSLIEIKRAKEKLFKSDRSHNNMYKATNLSKAESQCINYLRRVEECKRDLIKNELNVEVLRPKITLIYGSYSDDPDLSKKEKEELKSLNFHLNAIDIITYDDLIDMGEKIIFSYQNN